MKKLFLSAGAALVTVAIVSACASSPTGRKQLILMSDSQMEQMGVAAFAELKKKQPLERDASKQRYVECVSRAITAELKGEFAGRSWEISVFKDDSPNAFALPGGKIGVHTGMLTTARNQDQLAAVIGHEVAHVIARHGNERASASLASSAGLQIAAVMAGSDSRKQAAMAALGLGLQFGVILPYGRAHESEADRIGQDLMARAGFDPRESVSLWRNMKAEGGGSAPEFLSTHPAHDSRIQDLSNRLAKVQPLYEEARASGKRPKCG